MSRIFFLEAIVLSSKPRIYQLASNGIGLSNRRVDKLLAPRQLEEPAQVLFGSSLQWYGEYVVRNLGFRQY